MTKRAKKRINRSPRTRHQSTSQRRVAEGTSSKSSIRKKTPRLGKTIYFFGDGKAEGDRQLLDLLGGKGAGLAEMTKAGLPVPPGFTISTKVCTRYYTNGSKSLVAIDSEMNKHLKHLEKVSGAEFGSSENPLLVSVRSGSKFSMPGMMDTILNLGLNDASVEGLKDRTGNERFAVDSYRRFIQMFGNVVIGIPKETFEHVLDVVKKKCNVRADNELNAKALRDVVRRYKKIILKETQQAFPQDPHRQLRMARDAVFSSWMNPRAIEYRRIYNISDEIGTAVNVQMMVFGNTGNRSATGVGFTRNPATGLNEFFGEFLVNAQGEDVVAGIRTPQPIANLERLMPKTYAQLKRIALRLERHYRDIQDFEFTIQDERLYMLQTRNGKRTGYAAVVIATDLVAEKRISQKEAVQLVDPESLTQLLAPVFESQSWNLLPVIARGLPASPGAASGQVVFTAEDAVTWAKLGKSVLLVRRETVPDDIHGMHVAQGVLTATGGMTSHAAVVGRQMGKPSIVGAGDLQIDESKRQLTVGNQTIEEGEFLSFDGLTGEIKVGQVKSQPSEILQVLSGVLSPLSSDIYQRLDRLLKWADRYRRLGVRANADLPDQALVAKALGAEGIGLCRTEHMFFGEGRIPIVQRMILATNEVDRRKALDELRPLQRDDFYQVFKKMDGQPVTIRLIDPPLHEFLPKREDLMVDIARMESTNKYSERLEASRTVLRRLEQLTEFNPMLGHRGVRLAITYPEITEMQVGAIMEAACQLAREGRKVVPEIMIPLVSDVRELQYQKRIVERVASEIQASFGTKVKYLFGTMIEVPRAVLTADQIASESQFFSFGTNDLTQLGYGFSRDDAGKFLQIYQEKKILERDPFQSIDKVGIGELVSLGVERGRRTNPTLKMGICGEHGGDAASVFFFDAVGLDYVSASPYRVPVARLAAAQAALKAG